MLNVVNGDKEAVDAILDHPDVMAVSFVGSTPIAEYIYSRGTASAKRVQALGGAKNHMVVMPDADLAQATDALMGAGYGSAGERCMAVSVAVAVGDIGDRLIDELIPRVQSLRVGPGSDPEADMGPLVTKQHLDKVRGYVDLGVEEGAKLVRRRARPEAAGLRERLLHRRLPVRSCEAGDADLPGRDLRAGAVGRARARFRRRRQAGQRSRIRQRRAIFTRDGDAAREFASGVKIGMVGVNVPIPVPIAFTASAAGSDPSSATSTCTGPRACASIRSSRPSPRAGRPASAPAPNTLCRR